MKKQIEMIHTTFLEKHGHKKLIINRYFVCTVLFFLFLQELRNSLRRRERKPWDVTRLL